MDNGLGSQNNVITVYQKHFDATWCLLEKGILLTSIAPLIDVNVTSWGEFLIPSFYIYAIACVHAGDVKLREVRNLAWDVHLKWEDLGMELGISPDLLKVGVWVPQSNFYHNYH